MRLGKLSSDNYGRVSCSLYLAPIEFSKYSGPKFLYTLAEAHDYLDILWTESNLHVRKKVYCAFENVHIMYIKSDKDVSEADQLYFDLRKTVPEPEILTGCPACWYCSACAEWHCGIYHAMSDDSFTSNCIDNDQCIIKRLVNALERSANFCDTSSPSTTDYFEYLVKSLLEEIKTNPELKKEVSDDKIS